MKSYETSIQGILVDTTLTGYESIYGLESEYISFFAMEYEYNYPWRDMDLSPAVYSIQSQFSAPSLGYKFTGILYIPLCCKWPKSRSWTEVSFRSLSSETCCLQITAQIVTNVSEPEHATTRTKADHGIIQKLHSGYVGQLRV